ncbi:MAG: reactive intermediate/imine deaminase [Flavobacteriales bacterium TMED123]|nr:MAG: reactive intermediate/imine deaminase [Flavobacteriales bacterium TMED123]|tara:strand:- start:300 stop:677 length:378 start_codon:yes stop_codon:yes gene_type:complete
MKKIISTTNAPKAIGPYSQAILVDGTLYSSGQIAINPKNGTIETEDIKSETERVMQNLQAILKAAQMNFDNVVKCSIFLKAMSQYAEINEVYAAYFGENPPARETIEVSALPKDVNVEISLIARK